MIVTPWVEVSGGTDFRSIPALLASPRFAGKTGQELAVAIWEFMVDPEEGIYHFWTPLERGHNRKVTDPLKLLNVFGWCLCGTNANIMADLFRQVGLPDGRAVHINGHVVPEAFYDDAWHLLDADLRACHRKHPPHQEQIASVAELVADPTLVTDQQNPSQPYYLPDRPAAKMADLYECEPHAAPLYAEHAHTMDFVLRPGERLVRNTDNEGKWIWFADYDDLSKRYSGEWLDRGPWQRKAAHRSYGNGLWVYEPQLTDDFLDFELGVSDNDGLAPSDAGLATTRAGECSCTFEFDSPYVFTGKPARGDDEAADGCILEAGIRIEGKGSSARIEMLVGDDPSWVTVWEGTNRSSDQVRLDLTSRVTNAYRFLLRFRFDGLEAGGCGLESLRVESAIMVAPASLGRLAEGANRLNVRFGDAHGLPTRRWITQTDFRDGDRAAAGACRMENVRAATGEDAGIVPEDPDRDYEVVFRVDAPPHGQLQRIYALGAFRCKSPGDTAQTVAAWLSSSPDGPWERIFEAPVPDHEQRWHFSAEGEHALAAAGERAYVRFTGTAEMAHVKVRAAWLDERLGHVPAPLKITHLWQEATGCYKGHAECIAQADEPHAYDLNCGEDPKLLTVMLEVPSIPHL